jgi:hypothetical protein
VHVLSLAALYINSALDFVSLSGIEGFHNRLVKNLFTFHQFPFLQEYFPLTTDFLLALSLLPCTQHRQNNTVRVIRATPASRLSHNICMRTMKKYQRTITKLEFLVILHDTLILYKSWKIDQNVILFELSFGEQMRF